MRTLRFTVNCLLIIPYAFVYMWLVMIMSGYATVDMCFTNFWNNNDGKDWIWEIV